MNSNLKFIFALIVAALLVTTGWIIYKEMNPQWKGYQRAYYREEAAKLRQALAGADQAKRENLEKRLRYLSRPEYRIHQILLDGGRRADRCVTCHLDLEKLEKAHPQIQQFPFEQYGCTQCHGGVGRATEKSRAHSTLRIPHRPLYEYLQAHESKTARIDLFNFGADGRPIRFTGSKLCLRCHLGSHPRHVARWRKIKFQPLDKVRDKLKALRKDGLELSLSRCLGCHTTGSNAMDGTYLEDRVTCESCHGPGGFYVDLMAGGKAREGAELARANILETRTERVCLNCHRPDRHDSYLSADAAPVLIAGYLEAVPAPILDGRLGDAAWKTALETKVATWRLGDGRAPEAGAAVHVRAVYDAQRIYFIFRWSDSSRQEQMGRWIYRPTGWHADAAWADALALDWQTTAKVTDFRQGGCAVLCHTTGRFAEFPRMATRQEDAVVDEWYWNAFVAGYTGKPGDGFLDNRVEFIAPGSALPAFRWARAGQSAAHGSDTSGTRVPDVLGGLPLRLNVQLNEGQVPGPALRVEAGRQVALNPRDRVGRKKILPLYAVGKPEQGDSADLDGRASWADGYWTLELSRSLHTASSRDVQFDPSQNTAFFGLALWDGSAGDRHQVATLVTLRFQALLKAKSTPPRVLN